MSVLFCPSSHFVLQKQKEVCFWRYGVPWVSAPDIPNLFFLTSNFRSISSKLKMVFCFTRFNCQMIVIAHKFYENWIWERLFFPFFVRFFYDRFGMPSRVIGFYPKDLKGQSCEKFHSSDNTILTRLWTMKLNYFDEIVFLTTKLNNEWWDCVLENNICAT